MTMREKFSLGAVIPLGPALGAYFQGSFLQTIFVYLFTGGLILLATTLGILFAVRPKGIPLRFLLFTWWALAISAGLWWITGNGILAARANATREYVAQIIPILDQLKAKDGSYPKALPAQAPKPSCLCFEIAYSSDGETFRFAYDDIAGLMNAYEFYSSQRVWHHYSA